MSDEKTLFIGGSHDGERIAIRSGDHVRIPPNIRLPPKRPVAVTGIHDHNETFEPETYELTRLRGNEKTFEVFLLSGMPADDLLERLIDGYQTNLQS